MATYPGAPPNPLGFKCELNLASVWTDITNYVMLRNQVQITGMGRADESSSISASQLTLTLRNDGRFTPKNSAGAYYPNILRNTQIRISVNATSGTAVAYSGYRFFGEISSWPPATDISGRDTYVPITASGIWRRISASSSAIGSPYSRYVEQLTGTSVPATYWAMEDGSGSAVFVTDIGAGAAATFTGTPSFAADGTSFPGSDALPQFNGARITANVSSAATPTDVVVRFALSVPAAGDAITSTFTAGGELANILMPSGTGIKRVSVSLNQNSTLEIQGWAATTGGSPLWTGTVATPVHGAPVLVSAELTPSGSSVAWALRIISPGGAVVLDQVTGTQASSTLAAVTQVTLNIQGRLGDSAFGHLGVFYAVPSLITAAAALGGFAGEYAVVRFQRLCTETGIASTVIGSTSAAMGPQANDTLANILQSVEDTDGGLLYETRDQFGLGYRTLISLQNQAVAVTLNAAGGQIAPPAPNYDDQLIVNQWTVTNTDGYVAQATLTSGAVSIQAVPNGVGLYGKPAACNASTHAQVNAIAQQRLFTGTVDDVRYPTVTVNMAAPRVAPLFATVPGLRVGDYIQITNLPATVGGTATAKQLAWGYAETIGGNPEGWVLVFNCVPEAPFETGYSPGVYSVVQAPTQGVASGSAVGSSVSGSQLNGALAGGIATGTLSARSIGGVTSFIAAATPYDWSFAVSGTPADVTYFTCTEVQALPISTGDTFTNSGGLGGPFTVTSLDPPSGGNVNIRFTPDATSVMSTGSVYGGKNGDSWVNTSAGNQLEQWQAGAWVPIQFGPAALSFTAGGAKVTFAASAPGGPATGDLWFDSTNGYRLNQWNGSAWVPYTFGTSAITAASVTAALIAANTIVAGNIAAGAITTATLAANSVTAAKIAANTITASQIAAGTILASNIAASQVYAGFVDATQINALQYVASGTQGEFLAYSGTPAAGNLIASVSGFAGTDSYGNAYMQGACTYDPGTGKVVQLHTGAVSLYQSASQTGLAGGIYANPTYPGQATFISGQNGSDNQAQVIAYSSGNTSPARLYTGAAELDIDAFMYIDGWHAITLDTGWSTVSGYSIPQYRFTLDGCLQLAGIANWGSSATSNTNLNGSNQLPVAYRPNNTRYAKSYSAVGGRGAVSISNGGVITMTCNATYPAQYCDLDNIIVKIN